MSQEQGLWPERSGEIREGPARDGPALHAKITKERTDRVHDPVRGGLMLAKAAVQNNRITEVEYYAEDLATQDLATQDSATHDSATEDFAVPASDVVCRAKPALNQATPVPARLLPFL